MLGLTALGTLHTAISLVALVTGIWLLARDKAISPASSLGRTYLVTTFLTAVTALGIFQHGGFGPPHVLSILTLLALAVGLVAPRLTVLGRWSRYLRAAAFSSTILFHLIPGFTETLTRLPLGNPVFANGQAPQFKAIYGALLLLFTIGLVLQLRWLAGQGRPAAVVPAAA